MRPTRLYPRKKFSFNEIVFARSIFIQFDLELDKFDFCRLNNVRREEETEEESIKREKGMEISLVVINITSNYYLQRIL